MARNINLLVLLLAFIFLGKANAQERVVIHHLEVGPMLGRVQNWDNSLNNRTNLSIQNYLGVKVDKHHAVGISVGLDTYPGIYLVPIAFGWRGFLDHDKKVVPYLGLDIGHAAAFLNGREKNEFSESWYEGGLLLSPLAGIRLRTKSGKRDYSLSLAYRRQQAYFFEGRKSEGISIPGLPPGFSSLREEAYIFNSLIAKLGIFF
ncbi:hypothetical protein [Cecembia calidifontis]|jgi:hypothetical protein|uniref:Outer membrane protein with beta-barrel domain n=1 Tax=Cecembia calidifontis TaxID=1187080 RepID=A0A4Q7P957_9BACT|nr:hypothetical protein [Cecembia calidifontis]RZS96437.1 hypothetical protein BC751_2008 [Cecembia calidifontis]